MGEHSAQVSKTIAAGRPDVWRAFAEPDSLSAWFWPPRFATAATMDARPGGVWSIRSAPTTMGVSGVVVAAQPAERLELTWRWDGEDEETRVAITFADAPGGGAAGAGATVVGVEHSGFASEEAADDHAEGWADCLGRLATVADSQTTV